MIQNVKLLDTDTDLLVVPDTVGANKTALMVTFTNVGASDHWLNMWALNLTNGDTTANTFPFVSGLVVAAGDTFEFNLEKFLLEQNNKLVAKADAVNMIGCVVSYA